MPKTNDFSDERNKTWCIHCGATLKKYKNVSKDHVPSRSLLEKSDPKDYSTVNICWECNNSFAPDEEYFAALIGAVLSGSTDPGCQTVERAGKILASKRRLRDEIESMKSIRRIDGMDIVFWKPDMNRVENVIIKNARGHIYFECGMPIILHQPKQKFIRPIYAMEPKHRAEFFQAKFDQIWAEAGSLMMSRMAINFCKMLSSDQYDDDSWIVSEKDVYRYAVNAENDFRVRIIIREYLAADIIWDKEDSMPLFSWDST